MGSIRPEELGKCFDAHAAALVLYARQWLDEGLAQEAVQEAFLRLLSQPTEPRNARAWLFACVRNHAMSLLRSDRRQSDRRRTLGASATPWFEADMEGLVDAKAAQQALGLLPAQQREVVTLRIWGGLTLREISEITGQPISSVFHTYTTALAAIRQKMVSSCNTTKKS